MLGKRQLVTISALTIVFSALLLAAARPAQAQTESVLYNFNDSNPTSSLTSHNGKFYGTANGEVFELSPNGSGAAWIETVLYLFFGGYGGQPNSDNVIFDSVGNLYGTSEGGGEYGYGFVFELSPMAGGIWTATVLYNFCSQKGCPDGANPVNGLIMDPAGNLYGTTTFGSSIGVFELSPSGGGWTEQVIYEDASYSGLTMDAAGNIFGTTYRSVFELTPNGSGGWNPTQLHYFPGYDGFNRYSSVNGPLVFDQAGNLYGTTIAGRGTPYGTVFELSPRKRYGKRRLSTFFILTRGAPGMA